MQSVGRKSHDFSRQVTGLGVQSNLEGAAQSEECSGFGGFQVRDSGSGLG